MIRRGVTAAKAERLAREYPAEVIAGKVEVLDWLAAKGDKRMAKSPAGYLVKSIEEDYAAPQGFVSPAERRRREEARRAQEREKAEQRRREQEQAARDEAQRQAVDAYLGRLTPAERKALEAEALARAGPEARQCYEEAPGRLRATVLLGLLREHVAQELSGGDPRWLTLARSGVHRPPNSGYSGGPGVPGRANRRSTKVTDSRASHE